MKRRMLTIIFLVVAVVLLITSVAVRMVIDRIDGEGEDDNVADSGSIQGSVQLIVEAPRRIPDGG